MAAYGETDGLEDSGWRLGRQGEDRINGEVATMKVNNEWWRRWSHVEVKVNDSDNDGKWDEGLQMSLGSTITNHHNFNAVDERWCDEENLG